MRCDLQRLQHKIFKLRPDLVSSICILIINLLKIMKSKPLLLVILLCLLCSVRGQNWQATDNMTTSNLTDIWDYIDQNFDTTKPKDEVADLVSDTYLVTFAQNMAIFLNQKWARAWNVVVTYITDVVNADTVLYGYAFRNHWMWYNGYIMQDGQFVSFIIWKDYNCDHYFSYNSNILPSIISDLTQEADISTFLNQQVANWNYEDPWGAAFSFVDNLQKRNGYEGQAYSAIMSQSNQAYWYASVCIVGFYYSLGAAPTASDPNLFWGNMLLMRMR